MEPIRIVPMKPGDRVTIKTPLGGIPGKIVELRGPLGPQGKQVYRILLRKKPKPAYIEVLADQLETAEG